MRDVRNIAAVDVPLGARVAVISGDNGQGKTSLLEAIYLLLTSKSFRTSKLGEVPRHGGGPAVVRGRLVEEGGPAREQLLALEGAKRLLKVDGKRPVSLASYAVRSPVVCFHTDELELSTGPASARRTLLDRIALFVDAASVDHRERYRKALRGRQRALEQRGVAGADVEAFEVLCARHGAALTRARARAADELGRTLGEQFARVAAPGLELSAVYAAGGVADEVEAKARLEARREKDLVRGLPGFGPHRDELQLGLGGHPVRAVASQGQHRALTLAIKMAELHAIARARQLLPILLLDDVSSELDRDRTAALLSLVSEQASQVVITTTRRELIETPGLAPGERLDLVVSGGVLQVEERVKK